MKLIEGFDSNYRYILVAARRARQLQGGAPPVIDTGSRKPCRIAQDEIKAGKVKWLIPEVPKLPVVAASEILNKVFPEDALRSRRFRVETGLAPSPRGSDAASERFESRAWRRHQFHRRVSILKLEPPSSSYEECAGRVRWHCSL